MFKVIPNGANRLDLELNGKLDTDEMKVGIDEFIQESEKIENGRMLYDIIDIHFPSLAAIGVKIQHFPTLFRLFRRFSRVAVLTDKVWVQKVSEFEGHFFPGMEIKAFDRDQRDEAEAWLDQ
jgi:hypothetical protein